MGRSLIIMLLCIVSSPAQPSQDVGVTAVGKDPLWKIALRTALVADLKGKHALKISEGAGMGLVQNGISVPLTFLCADKHFGTDLAQCHEAASEATVGCEAEDRLPRHTICGPASVMEILGHKDLNTTMRIYGDVVDQMKHDAAAFLNSYEFSYQARLRAGCELT